MYLNRLTGFDHQCRVRYNIVLGEGERRLDSGILDDVSDSDGKGYGWHPRTRFNDLVYKVQSVHNTTYTQHCVRNTRVRIKSWRLFSPHI